MLALAKSSLDKDLRETSIILCMIYHCQSSKFLSFFEFHLYRDRQFLRMYMSHYRLEYFRNGCLRNTINKFEVNSIFFSTCYIIFYIFLQILEIPEILGHESLHKERQVPWQLDSILEICDCPADRIANINSQNSITVGQ